VKNNDNSLKSRIQPYVTHDLHQRLAAYVARRNLTESAVVERALREHLDGIGDLTLLYGRLDRINRSIQMLNGTLAFTVELVDMFFQLWLRNTPQLPAADLRANKAVAERRHDNSLARIRAALTSGRTVLDRLPSDDLDVRIEDRPANAPRPEEAAAARGAAGPPPPPPESAARA
jgi:hypothetical protein